MIDFNQMMETQLSFMEEHHRKQKELVKAQFLRLARKFCKHPKETVRYFGDPSGNNESTHICSACGFEVFPDRNKEGKYVL